MKTDTPQSIRLKDYEPSAFLIDEVNLNIRLAPQRARVLSTLTMCPNPDAGKRSDSLVLDGEELELLGLMLNGISLAQGEYTVDEQSMTIHKVPDEPFTLVVETACDPEANTSLSGLYRSNDIYCTQCEAEGFRRITYYLDRPDVLTRYTVRIEARKSDAPILLANGNEVASGPVDGTERHFAVWRDPFPKPSYLFALVAGDLACVEDSFTTASGRDVVLRIYVEHGKEDRCAFAMDALKRSMRWDEEMFGREYDLDIFMIVAVSDFNMGAMENKGLNVFNDKYVLARPDTATDADYENIESIIAHEYFHNWTGNRITCRDWFQLCLKEGLTVFRDQEFSADMRSAPVQRIGDVRRLRSQQFPEDAGPLAHPVRPSSYIEINNFYTATVYEKGAELVRMMRTLIGPDDFRKAMDLYFERHDGEAATVEDFVSCMADASGRAFNQFMLWYNQAGTPELAVTGTYNRQDSTYDLTVTQMCPPTPDQPVKAPQVIPLALGLVGSSGDDLPLVLDGEGLLEPPVLEITAEQQSFRFSGVTEQPVPSLNRGFAAPIKLTSNLDENDHLFLMARDSDPFNRWEAGQTCMTKRLLANVSRIMDGGAPEEDARLAEALRTCLADQSLEPAFLSFMLSLPSESDLATQIGENVDPGAIHIARDHLRGALGNALRPELQAICSAHDDTGPYEPSAAQSGARALRGAAVSLICAAQGPELAYEHFAAATNMTDTMMALATLAVHDSDLRTRALAEFYERSKDDHLLVDKWLALHAIAPFPGKISYIQALTGHAAFSLKTPNKVRALIGTFAAANPVCFNDPAGAGYRLVADTVLALDTINPQVAARLAGAFRSWRVLEPGRRSLAKAEIERVSKREGLSRDTFEIIAKTLQ